MSSADDEIRRRLELLRGKTYSSSDKPSTSGILPVIPKKTAAEQVESLLSQLSEECSLENKVKKIDNDLDLRCRLERLKSREDCEFVPKKKVSSGSANNEDSDQSDGVPDEDYFNNSSCQDLVANLEYLSDSNLSSDVSEELCMFCEEEKPVTICLGCNKDYYCKKCFKEYHDPDEKHKTMSYSDKS